jgi:hypothetical protein
MSGAQITSHQVVARLLGARPELTGGQELKVGRLERGHAGMIAEETARRVAAQAAMRLGADEPRTK